MNIHKTTAAFVKLIIWKHPNTTASKNYIPRWKREKAVSHDTTCSYQNFFNKTKLITPNFMSDDKLEETLLVPPPYKLCNKHYQVLYHEFVTALISVPCSGCGIKPPCGKAFTRHSPNCSVYLYS